MPITPDETALLAAIESTFATFWAGRTQIANPNERIDPRAVQSWVRITLGNFQDNTRGKSGLGGVQEGSLTFEVYHRRGKGDADMNVSVELIKDYLFENRDIPETLVTNVDAITIGPDGPWFQKNVVATLMTVAQRALP